MIYIITHKIFDSYFEDKEHYKVLNVGSSINSIEGYANDNVGDNISFKNPNFCELTGLYWIWKNGQEEKKDITGLIHYRRYYTTRIQDFLYTYFGRMPTVLPYEIIENNLTKYDVILPVSEKICKTVKQSYAIAHNEEDLELTRKSILKICPEYLESFDKVMKSHSYYYANMIICKKEIMDLYSEWLFSILFDLEEKIDIDKYTDSYQKRVFGFLSERLLHVWVVHNDLRIKEFPVFNTEERKMNFFQKNRNRVHNAQRRIRCRYGKR